MSILCGKFEFVPREIGFLILAFLTILFLYPFLILIVVPLWIYRYFVNLLVRQADSNVGNILLGLDGVLAGNDPYNKPVAVLLTYLHLVDRLDIPQVVKTLQERVIKPGYYPELTKRIVTKHGYHFWYPVDNFKVEDHVHHLNPKMPYVPVTRMELRETLTNTVTKLPFNPSLSPWEILVVPNFDDDTEPEVKSCVVIRVNHCLMDGFSVMSFLQKCSMTTAKWFGEQGTRGNNNWFVDKCTRFGRFLLLTFTGPYYAFKTLMFPFDWNKFVRNTFQTEFQDKWASQCATPIPSSRMKSIKSSNGVSMSSLIATICAHVAQKSMKRARLETPKRIHAFLTYPLPGHSSDTLKNHWSMARIPIEIDKKRPFKTLKFVDAQLNHLKSSLIPLIFMCGLQLLSVLPTFLCYMPEFITPTTMFLTCMPGPSQMADVFGCKFKRVYLTGKTAKGFAFAFFCVGYNGNFYIDCGGPQCNLPSQTDADYLATFVKETLDQLEGKFQIKPEKILCHDI